MTVGFFDRARAGYDSLAGRADQALDAATASRGQSEIDQYYRDLGLLTYLPSTGRPVDTATQQHLGWVTERAALVAGIADSTMSHDEAWDFLSLGRSLERADMTARIVATGAIDGGPNWGVVLASCGAQQAMLRTMRGVITDRTAAAFLSLDRRFPRSVLASLREAEERLTTLSPDTDRVGFSDEARRILGQTRTQLEYADPDDVLDDLPAMMGLVQESVTQASDAIGARYFMSDPVQEWTGEIL